MAPFIWSDSDTLILIELYKSYEYLWNKNLPLYKDKRARQRAYHDIVNKLNKSITEFDVKNKIKNLRTSYYEIRRKNNTVNRRIWMQSFSSLMELVERESQKKLEVEDVTETSEDESEQDEGMHSDVEEEPDSYVVSIKEEFFDEMRSPDNATVADFLEPVEKKPKLGHIKDADIQDDAPMEITEAKLVNEERTEPERTVDRTIKVDEFQLFANSLAAQLRMLPLDRALGLEVDIQTLVAKERLKFHEEQKITET